MKEDLGNIFQSNPPSSKANLRLFFSDEMEHCIFQIMLWCHLTDKHCFFITTNPKCKKFTQSKTHTLKNWRQMMHKFEIKKIGWMERIS